LLVAGVVWALVNATRLPASGPVEPLVDVVKRRCAKGEIDRETYERMLNDLKGRKGECIGVV
jgi:uncharacterized membrane protein